MDLLRRGVPHHLVDQLNGNTRLTADAFITPILDVIELLKNRHGDHDLMLGERRDRGRIVQQHVGVEYVNLTMCRFELSDFGGLGCSQRHVISSRGKLKIGSSGLNIVVTTSNDVIIVGKISG